MSKYDLNKEFKKQLFLNYSERLLKKGAVVELREIKPNRNLDQNGLYWLWLTCLQVEVGMTKDEFHILYRAKFLKRDDSYVLQFLKENVWNRVKELTDQFHYQKEFAELIDLIAKSTTELDEHQFSMYLTAIKDHALNNYNVVLMNLEEKQGMEFYKEYLTHQ